MNSLYHDLVLKILYSEATCAAKVIETITRYRSLSPEELEAQGGLSVAVSSAVDEFHC